MLNCEHDELRTEEEISEVCGLFDELRDYNAILSDIGYEGVADWALHINAEIENLRRMGFLLFGLKRKLRFYDDKKNDIGISITYCSQTRQFRYSW